MIRSVDLHISDMCMHKLLVYVICPGITFASYLIVLDGIISLRSPSPLWPLPCKPGDHCLAAGEVTCVDMGECVMKSMAGRDHVGAFLVHGTCCVCRKVLVSSSISKYIVISHIVTTVICIYLYFISQIFICLTYHLIQRNTCFNLLCVLLFWCTVLWILIAFFICCICQKWRNNNSCNILFTQAIFKRIMDLSLVMSRCSYVIIYHHILYGYSTAVRLSHGTHILFCRLEYLEPFRPDAQEVTLNSNNDLKRCLTSSDVTFIQKIWCVF